MDQKVYQKAMSSRDGFTLIELAIVLSLIMILTAVTAPSLRGIVSSSKLKSSASEIHSLLTFARDVSITENTNYLVLFDLDEQQYWLADSEDFDMEDMSTSLAANQTESSSETETTTATSSEDEVFFLSRTSNLLGIPKEPKANVEIAMISVAHGSQATQITTGTDYVCFTPTGTAEEMTVYLVGSRGNGMSISVDGAIGRASVEKVDDTQMEELGLSLSEEE